MIRPNGRALLALALVALSVRLPSSSAAVGETTGFGARASSLGGAITASVDDPSAIYYNPAGLTLLDGPVGWLDVIAFTGFGDVRSPETGESADFNLDPFVFRPTPILAGPLLWDDIYWGLGLLGTAGLASRFPEDYGANRFASYSSKLLDTVLASSLAWRASERLSLGVTFEVSVLGKFSSQSRFGDGYFGDAFSAMTGNEISTRDGEDDAHFRLTTDEDVPTGLRPTNDLWANLRSFAFVGGIQYQVAEKIRAGLVYREKSEPRYEGRAEVRLEDSVRSATGLVENPAADFEADVIARPRMVVGGLALGPFDGWTLHGDLQWSQWGEARDLEVSFGGDGLLGQKTLVVPLEWHDTVSFRVGIEHAFASGKRFWAGYWLDKSPTPDRTHWAALPPGDLHFASIGGLFPDALAKGIDLAVYGQLALSDSRYLGRGESRNAGGTKNFVVDDQGRLAFGANDEPITWRSAGLYAIGLTFTYRWDDVDWF